MAAARRRRPVAAHGNLNPFQVSAYIRDRGHHLRDALAHTIASFPLRGSYLLAGLGVSLPPQTEKAGAGRGREPELTGTPFNEAIRYMDWLLTVPMLLMEIVLR